VDLDPYRTKNNTAPQNWFFVLLIFVVCCQVLVEGLPDWRMPAYYFRRMRKIGLAEGLAYLLGESSSPISFRAKVSEKYLQILLFLFDGKKRLASRQNKHERRSFKTEYDDI
jgi:hypothetical protein